MEKCLMFVLTGNVEFAGIALRRKRYSMTTLNFKITLDVIATFAIKNIQVLELGKNTSHIIICEMF